MDACTATGQGQGTGARQPQEVQEKQRKSRRNRMFCVSVSLGEEDMPVVNSNRAPRPNLSFERKRAVRLYLYHCCFADGDAMLHLDHTQKMAAARHSSQARRDAQRSLQVGAWALLPAWQPCGTVLMLGGALQVAAGALLPTSSSQHLSLACGAGAHESQVVHAVLGSGQCPGACQIPVLPQ